MLDNENKKSTISTVSDKDFSSVGSFMQNKGLVNIQSEEDPMAQLMQAIQMKSGDGRSGIGSVL